MTDTKSPNLLQRLAASTAKLFVTAGFVAVAGVAVWQGSSLLASRAAAVEKPESTEPLAVSVSTITMQNGYMIERSFTGQIEAPQTAQLSFEQGGTLADVMVDDGDQVSDGELIAKLDDRLLRADLDRLVAAKQAIAAQLELATLTDQRQAELKSKGFASAQTADQTRLSIIELQARMAETEAAILAAEVRLEKTEIRAPFAGTINRRLIDPGNTVGGGQGVVSLVENGQPVFRVGVDPRLAAQLAIGDTTTVELEGMAEAATLIAVLPQIDPATRTRTVRARLDEAVSATYGQTGELVLTETVGGRGAWIPLTALEDGVRGLWTIKTIAPDETTVGVEAVEIIHADSTRAFVRGTFTEDTRFVDGGVHRVVSGQTVRVED